MTREEKALLGPNCQLVPIREDGPTRHEIQVKAATQTHASMVASAIKETRTCSLFGNAWGGGGIRDQFSVLKTCFTMKILWNSK
jgi:hypothetical protein